jgi:MFS family permease
MASRDHPPSFHLAILLFVVAIAIVYTLQNLISPGLIVMSEYFGFGGETRQLGTLTFTFLIVGGGMTVIFGYLTDKIVRVRIFFIGVLLFAVPATLVLLVGPGRSGYVLFFVLQMVSGAGLGATYPVVFSMTGDIVPIKNRSMGYSYFSIATLAGTVIGNVVGVIFVGIDWRISYALMGFLGLGAAAFALFLKEPSRLGRDFLFSGDKNAVEYSYRIRLADVKQVFLKKTNFWLIINFVSTVPTGIILFLLYKYLQSFHDVPDALAIYFLGLVIVATLVGTLVFGGVSDRLYAKHRMARVYLALFANVAPIPFVFIGLFIPFWLPPGGTILDLFRIPNAIIVIVLLCTGLFLNGAQSGSWYATVVDINLPEHRGTVLSLANAFETIGRAIGPLIGGFLADAFGVLVGISSSIVFWCAIPLFWIGVIRHFIVDMDDTQRAFKQRLEALGQVSDTK